MIKEKLVVVHEVVLEFPNELIYIENLMFCALNHYFPAELGIQIESHNRVDNLPICQLQQVWEPRLVPNHDPAAREEEKLTR